MSDLIETFVDKNSVTYTYRQKEDNQHNIFAKNTNIDIISVEIPDNICELNIPEEINGYVVKTISSNCIIDGEDMITKITIPKTVRDILPHAFSNLPSLQEVYLNDGLLIIGKSAFCNCPNLKSIHFPRTLKSIHSLAFSRDISLKEISLPKACLIVGEAAFAHCSGLESVSLNADSISSNLFSGCNNLKNVRVSSNLVHICANAFDGCYSLEKLDLSKVLNLEYVHPEIFKSTNLKEIILPENIYLFNTELIGLLNSDSLETIKVPKENKCFYVQDECLFERIDGSDEVRFIKFPAQKRVSNFVLPDNVVDIHNMAFANAKFLESISMSNVKYCGYYAFANCENLKDIKIKDESLTCIPGSFVCGCKSIKTFKIPKGCTAIGLRSFEGAESLSRLYIPSTVETIYDNKFIKQFNKDIVFVVDKDSFIEKYLKKNKYDVKILYSHSELDNFIKNISLNTDKEI